MHVHTSIHPARGDTPTWRTHTTTADGGHSTAVIKFADDDDASLILGVDGFYGTDRAAAIAYLHRLADVCTALAAELDPDSDRLAVGDARLAVGRRVVYHPGGGQPEEAGTISSVYGTSVFVLYDGDATAKSTAPEDLSVAYGPGPVRDREDWEVSS